jgi:hypothetical protein
MPSAMVGEDVLKSDMSPTQTCAPVIALNA